MKYLVILLITLVLIGCSNGKAFLELNDITDKHKLYIIPMEFILSELGSTNELLIDKPIIIEKTETIITIVKEWGHGRIENPAIPIYRVFLTENEKIIRSLSINEDLTALLTGHGKYNFSPELLFKHQETIESLDWITIEAPNVRDAKSLISHLSQISFIYPAFIEPPSDFTNSLGEISVRRKMIEGIEEYDSILVKDFQIDSIFIRSSNFQTADSVSLTFWTTEELDSTITPEYVVTAGWQEFSEIKFKLVGCKPELVKAIIEEHGIEVNIK